MKPIDKSKAILKAYWNYARKYPMYVIGLITFMPITLLIHQFLPPLIAANILSKLSSGAFTHGHLGQQFTRQLWLYGALVLAGGAVAWRLVIYLTWKLETNVVRDIYQSMFKHFTELSADFHANSFGGSLVSQTNKFASSYIRIADTTLFQVYTLVLAFVFTSVILAKRAPIFVIILLVFSALFMATAVMITKKVRILGAKESNRQNTQTGYLADMLTNILAVKSFATSGQEIGRFAKATEHTRQATLELMRASIKRDAYFGVATSVIGVLALVMGTVSVVIYGASIATVFLVLTYTANILDRLWEFSQNTLRNYNRALGDAKDAMETLEIQPSVKDPIDPECVKINKGQISFNGVAFDHGDNNSHSALFHNLNLNIKAGEKIGLIGHSGSGKTTLTKLLLRFVDVDSGQILIDGQDISSIKQDDLRSKIAYVPQEPLLFHRSLAENIAYGKPDASNAQITSAAKKAHAHEFISLLPQKYKTLVGERGVKLSGGQRQRVAIARAMIKDAPIIVLDEATSALDSESEKLIQQALWKLMEGRTAIVIAHRLSTIQNMDRIIVLDAGKIVEQGSHKELLQNNGVYAKLWGHQSGGFLED